METPTVDRMVARIIVHFLPIALPHFTSQIRPTYKRLSSVVILTSHGFVGVAIYYLSQIFQNNAPEITVITLDSDPPVSIDLRNPAGVNTNYDVRWSKEGLTNGPHTLVLTPASTNGVAEVDGFIYTTVPVTSSPAALPPVSSDSSSPPSSSVASSSAASSQSSGATSPISATTSTSSRKNKGGVVAGSVIGALAIAGAAAAAFIAAHQLAYFFKALLYSLLGIFLFKARRLVFKVDEHLPQSQITFLLSENEKWEDAKRDRKEKPLVWKVFDIGGGMRDFDVLVPCETPSGLQKLGYGTVQDSGGRITCPLVGKSPAIYEEEDGVPIWKEDNVSERPKLLKHASARNASDIGMRFAVGTFDHKDEEGEPVFEPFLLIDALDKDDSHSHSSDLYLHVFRSNGFQPGQYRDDIGKWLSTDSLLPTDKGLPVKKLGPLTTWYIKPLAKGKLKVTAEEKEIEEEGLEMVQGKNSAKDIKAYEHEFKLRRSKKVTKGTDNIATVA